MENSMPFNLHHIAGVSIDNFTQPHSTECPNPCRPPDQWIGLTSPSADVTFKPKRDPHKRRLPFSTEAGLRSGRDFAMVDLEARKINC
jgi:hypothetical protein